MQTFILNDEVKEGQLDELVRTLVGGCYCEVKKYPEMIKFVATANESLIGLKKITKFLKLV